MPCSAWVRRFRYKLAAMLTGGTVHQFEGYDGRGKWYKGLVILSPEAMRAHKVTFRPEARVYSDTAITEPRYTPNADITCGTGTAQPKQD
jgi:hypothetical protein